MAYPPQGAYPPAHLGPPPMGSAAPMPSPTGAPILAPTGAPTSAPHAGTRQKLVREKGAPAVPGLLGVLIVLAIGLFGLYDLYIGVVQGAMSDGEIVVGPTLIGLLCLVIAFFCQSAFTIVQPGQTKVLQFLGNYVGTIRATGLRMTYPFTTKRQVSIKVRNFETREIKVNDSQGNPVMIAAIIVWQVQDTAQSVFQVEYYEQFVQVQAEAALRHIATIHPYDNGDEGEATLRGATDQVAAELAHEVGERVSIAGVDILETRISSLSYAPEIASAMLQRQQAQAVLAARAKIVEGAVTMVESALNRIETQGIVEMSGPQKASMVSNLLVVLCSDSRAMPTLNTGL
jgi:regulator of protease activity HflC (stomatin/prohibitin superfamily)